MMTPDAEADEDSEEEQVAPGMVTVMVTVTMSMSCAGWASGTGGGTSLGTLTARMKRQRRCFPDAETLNQQLYMPGIWVRLVCTGGRTTATVYTRVQVMYWAHVTYKYEYSSRPIPAEYLSCDR